MRHRLSLLLLLAAAPAAAQDGADPGTWQAAGGERLQLSWSYSRREKTSSSEDGKAASSETREVTARLVAPEAGFSGEGSLALTLESVDWTVSQPGYTVRLKRRGDAAPTAEVELRDDETEAEAEGLREELLDRAQRRYRLAVRPGEASLQVETSDGWAGGFSSPSLFDRCYVHSPLPDGGLRSTQKWIDPRAAEALPLYGAPGESKQFPQVKLKLTLGPEGLQAKGSGTASFSGRTMMNWKYTGRSKVTRSFSLGPRGRLLESSETGKGSIKRTDRGRRQDGAIQVEQRLTLTPLGG